MAASYVPLTTAERKIIAEALEHYHYVVSDRTDPDNPWVGDPNAAITTERLEQLKDLIHRLEPIKPLHED